MMIPREKWSRIRRHHIARYYRALRKGEVDDGIRELIEHINRFSDDIVTTSSCYGRITLLKLKRLGEKSKSNFLYKWHHPADIDEIWRKIVEFEGNEVLWLKIQSTIIHVKCRTIDSATKIRNLGIMAGYKFSKILSISENGITVEISGTERMSLPVKIGGVMLIKGEFKNILKDVYNEMFKRIEDKKMRFINLLKKENAKIQK